MYINKNIKFLDRVLTIKSGWFANNTESSILVEIDGTVLLVTVVYTFSKFVDFLPLKIEYFERFYANCKIPSNYLRREGKLTEREILISRLIDRSIRPMFLKILDFDIQITVMVISVNSDIDSDIIAINAVSFALYLSDLPFVPVIALKVSYKDNFVLFNPSITDLKNSNLELVVSGFFNKIVMLEGIFNEVNFSFLFECISKSIFKINDLIYSLISLKKYKKISKLFLVNKFYNVFFILKSKYYNVLFNLYIKSFFDDRFILNFKNNLFKLFLKVNFSDFYKKYFLFITDFFFKFVLRKKILITKIRIDFRNEYEIRKIFLDSNILNKLHGSSIFTRGLTQSLVSVTLGTYRDSQIIDCVFFSHYKSNFILHYNFPPYSVNEIGNFNFVKRREIGHGYLAKKALNFIIPKFDDFPYVIRVVSEILSSNGSSSMATICATSIALMASGIPIKSHVVGISMGLIVEENRYLVFSDISGNEDFFGDMDFKISATKFGFTSLQMDLKIFGINFYIIKDIIFKSKFVLDLLIGLLENHISEPRKFLSAYVPKFKIIKIDKTKIGLIIGKNGSVIKNLMEKYNADIDISDDGLVKLSSVSIDNINFLIEEIFSLTFDFKVGMIFEGKIIKINQFGALVKLVYKKIGLLHISKINKYKNNNNKINITEGSIINVVIISIDLDGKLNLNFV